MISVILITIVVHEDQYEDREHCDFANAIDVLRKQIYGQYKVSDIYNIRFDQIF